MSMCHSEKLSAETRMMPGGRDCWICEMQVRCSFQ